MPEAAIAPAPAAPAREPSSMENAFTAIENAARPVNSVAEGQAIAQTPQQRIIRPGEKGPKPGDAKTPPGAPAKPQDAPQRDDLDPDDDTTDPPDQPAKDDQPAPADQKPDNQQPAKPKRPSDYMREEIARLKAQTTKYEEELKTIKNTPREDPEKKSLQEKLSAMEKRQQEIEDEYRLHAYEKSSEYKDKYHKPFVEAYARGRAKVSSLEVTDKESGDVRAATPEDFDTIMRIDNDKQASRLAKEMFGDDYAIVIHHRERILEANSSKNAALEEAKKSGSAKITEQQTKSKAAEDARTRAFETERKSSAERHEWFKPVDGDEAWNKSVERGRALADKAFMGANGMPPEEVGKLHAAVYNRALAYSPMKLQIKRLKTELDTIKKELAEYKDTEPGNGEGATPDGVTAPPGRAMDQAFDAINKKARPFSQS